MVKQICNGVTFNPIAQKLTIGKEEKSLTTKESELFDFLSNNINNLSARSEVLSKIWGNDDYFNARSMDVYITRLRKLLKPATQLEILNVHGAGYKLIINE